MKVKDKKYRKKREGRDRVSAAISSAQRGEEIRRGIEAFKQDRENEDLLLV